MSRKKNRMNSKYKIRNILAWGFVLSLLLASITVFKTDYTTLTDEVVVESNSNELYMTAISAPTQVEILTSNLQEMDQDNDLTPILSDDILEEMEFNSDHLHFTNDGILIADYENFSNAFAFARGVLGDSSEDGKLRIFSWRDNQYHTEWLKPTEIQLVEKDSVEEKVITSLVEPTNQ
jgi:hypothetical protein